MTRDGSPTSRFAKVTLRKLNMLFAFSRVIVIKIDFLTGYRSKWFKRQSDMVIALI